jgi:hypothetical protein
MSRGEGSLAFRNASSSRDRRRVGQCKRRQRARPRAAPTCSGSQAVNIRTITAHETPTQGELPGLRRLASLRHRETPKERVSGTPALRASRLLSLFLTVLPRHESDSTPAGSRITACLHKRWTSVSRLHAAEMGTLGSTEAATVEEEWGYPGLRQQPLG